MGKVPFASASAVVRSNLSKVQYDQLADMMTNRHSSWVDHEKLLKADSADASNAAFHVITRHGPQTGWESQLLRIVTGGYTPDQATNPTGAMDAIADYESVTSKPKREQGNLRYANANTAGAFLSPEVENFAISEAVRRAQPLMGYTHAETKTRRGTTTKWEEYSYIDVVLKVPGQCAGISFIRGKHARVVPTAEAIEAIKDFINQKRAHRNPGSPRTYERAADILRDADGQSDSHAMPYYRMGVKRDFPLRFTSLSDLLTFLDVTAVWMTHVNVCLRRVGTEWKTHTAYAVGARNASKVDPSDKVAREEDEAKQGFNVKPVVTPSVKSGGWTGRLSKSGDGSASVYVDPASLLV